MGFLNAIYWFNKISLISIQIGLFLIPISIILSIPLPTTAFFSYYLLSIFDYVNKKKILIISGIIAGLICFYLSGYRSGVVMIILSILIFFINRLNNKKLNKFYYIFFS